MGKQTTQAKKVYLQRGGERHCEDKVA